MIVNQLFYDPTNLSFFESYLDNKFGDAVIKEAKQFINCSVVIADISRYEKYYSHNGLKIFIDLESNSNFSKQKGEEYFNPFKYTDYDTKDLIKSFDNFIDFCLEYYNIIVFIPDNCRPILEVDLKIQAKQENR